MARLAKEIPKEIADYFVYRDGELIRVKTDYPRHNNLVGEPVRAPDGSGYYQVHFKGARYRVHRVVWFLLNGPIPEGAVIDHKDGNVTNNSIENLRLATQKQNSQNCKSQKHSKTGIRGVSRHAYYKHEPRYQVFVGAQYYGLFDDIELAELIAKEARHKVFGEFKGRE